MTIARDTNLQRGPSEFFEVNMGFNSSGVALGPRPGVNVYLPLSKYPGHELMQVVAYTDALVGGKGAPTQALLRQFYLTLSTPDGDLFVKDMPLLRIAPRVAGAPSRAWDTNLLFTPRVVDAEQCFVYTATVGRPTCVLEFIYRA